VRMLNHISIAVADIPTAERRMPSRWFSRDMT
jgi:hypothetical protein